MNWVPALLKEGRRRTKAWPGGYVIAQGMAVSCLHKVPTKATSAGTVARQVDSESAASTRYIGKRIIGRNRYRHDEHGHGYYGSF
jgi:hypothetical protein